MDEHRLIGRWRIREWVQRYDDGRVTHPLGQALSGFIQYDADGAMSCMMGRADRAAFASGGQWNANEAERAGAYSSFMAYAGTYVVKGDVVEHHVSLSLFPNWVDGIQKRKVNLVPGATPQEDQLEISARLEEGTPEARTALLLWSRAASPEKAGVESVSRP